MLDENKIKKWDNEGHVHWMRVVNLTSELIKSLGMDEVRLIDIGSNIGGFTERLSKEVNVTNAVLVEPIRELLEFSKTKVYHIDEPIIFLEMALSDYTGEGFIHVETGDNLGCSRIFHEGRKIPINKLSDLMGKEINFIPNVIKIDAEGSDINILRDIENIIDNSQRPLIIFEVSLTSTPQDDLEFIKDFTINYGYSVEDFNPEAVSKDLFLVPRHK